MFLTVPGHRERERNVLFNDALNTFYLPLYGSYIWLRTILIVREETRCRHIGYSFRLAARVLLYAPSHRQDSTYHGLCYTSRGGLAGTRNSSMGPPHEGSIRQPITRSTSELRPAPLPRAHSSTCNPVYLNYYPIFISHLVIFFTIILLQWQLFKQFMKLNYFINCNQMKITKSYFNGLTGNR